MNHKAEQYNSALRRDVHRDAAMRRTVEGELIVSIPCTGCGITDAFHMRQRLPPAEIANKLKDKGWTFGGNRTATCPNHKRQRENKVDKTVEKPVRTQEEARETTDRARRAKRDTVLLLDDVFDAEKGCYRKGESDDSVSKIVGLSPEAVRFIREDMFGPIKRPPELAQLIDDLTALEKRAAQHASEAREIEQAIAQELRGLKARIEAMGRKYG